MAEYSRIARGSFTTAASPVPQVVNLPFQPQRVKLLNYNAYSAPAQYAVTKADWDIAMGQGVATFEYIESASAAWIPAVDYTTNGISTFSSGLQFQFGAQQQVVASTKGTTTSFQVTGHGYNTGDVVMFEGLYNTGGATGMAQMCGMPFMVTKTDADNFTVNFNSNNSSYTNLATSPTGAYVKKVLYPFMYEPGVSFITAITTGTTTTVTTSCQHNFVVGQEIAFRIPSAWGTTQLNELPNSVIPGSPIYGYVTSVTSTTFVCNINSSAYTAFTTAIAITSVPGLSFPQVFAVGDVNTGGVQYSGGALYPSPVVNGFPTINGPAIQGAYVNNTSQGFVIQTGVGAVQSSALLLTASSLYIWEAYLYDISS